jgi:hypothetical protein
MNYGEHINQSERLLKEAAEDPTAPSEERLVWVTAALAHATLAQARLVMK